MAFWRDFKNKEELEAAIRAAVDAIPLFVPFRSDLISDLVLERHYYYSRVRMRPTEFRKDDVFKPYRFTGRFPGTDWLPVSWRKSLDVPNNRRIIIQGLRWAIAPDIAAFAARKDKCDRCGKRGPIQVHHYKPPFREIVNAALHGVNEEQMDAIVQAWNWQSADKFKLPPSSPILQKFMEGHRSATLVALCKKCHSNAGFKLLPHLWDQLTF